MPMDTLKSMSHRIYDVLYNYSKSNNQISKSTKVK